MISGVVGTLDEGEIKGDGAIRNIELAGKIPRWCANPLKFVSDPSGDLTIETAAQADLTDTSPGDVRTLDSSQTGNGQVVNLGILETSAVDDGTIQKNISSTCTVLIPSWSPTKQANIGRLAHRCQIRRAVQVSDLHLWNLSTKYDVEFGNKDWGIFNSLLLCFVVNCIPIAIIGGLSHFQRGHSTTAERGWTMAWLGLGMFFGPSVSYLWFLDHDQDDAPETG